MRVTQNQHRRGDWTLNYRLVDRLNPGSRRLVLLHGAGVAGALTFGGMLPALTQASEVLVPDLYGAGETFFKGSQEAAFSVTELVGHLTQLLGDLKWTEFDLAGYSFGGLVAMKLAQTGKFSIPATALVEPALMERDDWQETLHRRRLYTQATQPLKTESSPEAGVSAFLDLVSPHRSRHPRVERRVVSRLAHRPVGLAHALEAVAREAETLDRQALIASQSNVLSVVGGKTPEPAHALHRQLATRHDWHYHCVPGCDHALPYQKPAVIAELLNGFTGTDA